MARLTAFQYLVLKHPLKDKEQEEDTVILLESKEPILAKNQEIALMMVARMLNEEQVQELDRIEFFVRPF